MQFTVDLFSSAQCDASGYGEGQTFLGTYTGISSGGGVLNLTQPLSGLVDGEYLRPPLPPTQTRTPRSSRCASRSSAAPILT
jgi:hypothetical protein